MSDTSKIRNLSRQKRDDPTFELLIVDIATHEEKKSNLALLKRGKVQSKATFKFKSKNTKETKQTHVSSLAFSKKKAKRRKSPSSINQFT